MEFSLEKQQTKANRKRRRRMRVQWTRDWIIRRITLFGQYWTVSSLSTASCWLSSEDNEGVCSSDLNLHWLASQTGQWPGWAGSKSWHLPVLASHVDGHWSSWADWCWSRGRNRNRTE